MARRPIRPAAPRAAAPKPQAGYSGTPLLAKLGYRDGQRALFVAVPAALDQALSAPEFAALRRLKDAAVLARLPAGTPWDVAHVFATRRADLERAVASLGRRIAPTGMLWVSWPKKASGVPSEIDENAIRAAALANGLVDVKVCAIDETWSGLKLVVPRARR